jgi:DNA repair exonuclease SbcCD ATPase subunit
MSKSHRLTSSNFDTVTNLQKSNPNPDFQVTLKTIGSRLRGAPNPTGNNNTVHNDSSDRLGSTIDRLRPSLEKSKRSVSPIFEKYGLSEKPSLQSSGNKNEIRCGNDSFGMPYHQPERDTFGPNNNENSINSMAKNLKKDQGNSSAIAGAMRALQDKLTDLEKENHWLRENLKSQEKSPVVVVAENGKRGKSSEGKKIDELKKEIEKEKFKCQELDIKSLKMEGQLDKLTREKNQLEKQYKDKVKKLEKKLQETSDQLQLHSQELEVITEFCGTEKKSLKEALSAVRTKYRSKVDQYNTNIEALDKERKKLRVIIGLRDEENDHLKKKLTLLETFLQNSIQNTQTDTSQVLEELKQINESILMKAQKTSESLVAETYLLEKPTGLDVNLENFTKSLGATKRSSSRSTSATKQRLCATLQTNHTKTLSSTTNKLNEFRKEFTNSTKKRSKSPNTGKKKKTIKDEFSASLAVNKQAAIKSRDTSPIKRRVLSYSARNVEEILNENKKPLTVHDLDSSPRFSRNSSPMKPILAKKKSLLSSSKGSKTKSLRGGL